MAEEDTRLTDPVSDRPDDDTNVERGREYPGMPRWVKVFGSISLGLVLLVIVVLVVTTALGLHTPGGPGGHGFGHSMPTVTSQESSGLGGPADADSATRTIEITTHDNMTFQPSHITVSRGETVAFVVTNSGQAVHEFTLGDAAMQQAHATEMAQMGDGMAHAGANTLTLQPGETKQLTWRFGDPGTLEYGCHEPGHYSAGMRGQITVQQP